MTKATPFISKSLAETRDYAELFLHELVSPQKFAAVIALSGDLGAGKTAFVKELGTLLGLSRSEITSPTFVIMKVFEISHPRFKRLIHIDAYRLEKEKELLKLGWEEIVADPENLILIEWPELVKGLIPKTAQRITFRFIDEDTREITVK